MGFFNRNKKDLNEPEPGSYKVVPSHTYDKHDDKHDDNIQVPCYIIEYYLKYKQSSGGEWKAWEYRTGRRYTFSTEQEAKTAYEAELQNEYKMLMHLESGSNKIYGRYQFIQDKAAELGIETRIIYGKLQHSLIFNTNEDKNLFQLTTNLKETSELLFLSEDELKND